MYLTLLKHQEKYRKYLQFLKIDLKIAESHTFIIRTEILSHK